MDMASRINCPWFKLLLYVITRSILGVSNFVKLFAGISSAVLDY